MTPIADMVERMLAESAPAAAILTAVRAMEGITLRHVTVTSPSRDELREKANARAKKYRNKKKNQRLAKANDMASPGVVVTLNTVTRHVTQPVCTDVSIKEEGLSVEGKKAKKRNTESARARGTRLNAGDALTNEFIMAAVELGADHDIIPKIWVEFVDYWCAVPGARGTKLNWLATWRNRVRDVSKGGRYAQRPNSLHPNSGAQQSGSTAVLAGVAAAAERRARERGAAGQPGPQPGNDDSAKRPDPELFGAQ